MESITMLCYASAYALFYTFSAYSGLQDNPDPSQPMITVGGMMSGM